MDNKNLLDKMYMIEKLEYNKKLLLRTLYVCKVFIILSILLTLLNTLVGQAATRNSITSGSWSNPSVWDCTCVPGSADDVTIFNNHSVTLTSNTTVVDLTIANNALLDNDTYSLTVNGSYANSGDHSGTGDIILNGSTMSGNGVISNSGQLQINGYVIVKTGVSISKTAGDVWIAAGATLDNMGTFSITGNIDGANASSQIIASSGSHLNVGGSFLAIAGNYVNGGLPHTLNFNGSSPQNIPAINHGNVTFSGTGIKTLTTSLSVDDFNIESGATVDVSVNNYAISLTGDWVSKGTFVPQNGTVTFNGSGNQALNSPQGENFYNLALNNSGGNVIATGDVHLNNTLTLTDGDLDMGTDTLSIDAGGSISGGGTPSKIQGAAKKCFNTLGAFKFPLGINSNYTPMIITLNPGTGFAGASDCITVKVYEIKHPGMITLDYVNRYWKMLSIGFTSLNYDLHYEYITADITGKESAMFATKWDGTQWTAYDKVDSINNALSSSTGITDHPINNDFSGGSGLALPITLSTFEAESKTDHVAVNWTTLSEQDNDFFEVQRSVDGLNYEMVEVVESYGDHNSLIDYQVMDRDPEIGISYYRLKQTDLDGKSTYSDAISVEHWEIVPLQVSVYPNPVSSNEALQIDLEYADVGSDMNITLVDMMGKEIYSQSLANGKECCHRKLTLDDLVAGLYYLKVSNSYRAISKPVYIVDGQGTIY